MKKNKFNLYSVFAILAFFLIIACANTPHLVGKWKEIGKAATTDIPYKKFDTAPINILI